MAGVTTQADSRMAPVLALTGAGYLGLALIVLIFSGRARAGLKDRIFSEPASYGADAVIEVLRELHPSAPAERKEEMFRRLQRLTAHPGLFADCAPDHPLKNHVLALIRGAAEGPLTPVEADALAELLLSQSPAEKRLGLLLTTEARKRLFLAALASFEERIRNGTLPTQDVAGKVLYRVRPSAKDLYDALDDQGSLPPAACREAMLAFGLPVGRESPATREWVSKGLERAEGAAVQQSTKSLIALLKRIRPAVDERAGLVAIPEARAELLALLLRTPEQAASLVPLVTGKYASNVRKTEDALIRTLLTELPGEARTKIAVFLLSKELDGQGGAHLGRGDLGKAAVSLGVDLPLPVYEPLLAAGFEWAGDQEPFDSMFGYTVSHPAVHAAFLKQFQASPDRVKMRVHGLLARAKPPEDPACWAFVRDLAFTYLDKERQGSFAPEFLKFMDLSEEPTRRHIAELMSDNRINSFLAQPQQSFRVARAEDVSNLYALVICRIVEKRGETLAGVFTSGGIFAKWVSVPADRQMVKDCVEKHQPELLKQPAFRSDSASPPAPRPALVPPPPPPKPEPKETALLRLNFRIKPSPEHLKEILPKFPPGDELRQLLSLVRIQMNDARVDDGTRRQYSEIVTVPEILGSAFEFDQITLAWYATPEARKKSYKLTDPHTADVLTRKTTTEDFLHRVMEATLASPRVWQSVRPEVYGQILCDKRLTQEEFDQLLEIVVVKDPVQGPVLDQVAQARSIEGGGFALFTKGFLKNEPDLGKRLARIDLALGPNQEQRGVLHGIRDTGKAGPDEPFFSALLEDLRKHAGAYKGSADDRLRIPGLTHWVNQNRLSPSVQPDLIRTFNAVPATLPALRWDLYRAVASFLDARAATFLIQNLSQQNAVWTRIGNDRNQPIHLTVLSALRIATGVNQGPLSVSDAEAWLKKNQSGLKNQFAP